MANLQHILKNVKFQTISLNSKCTDLTELQEVRAGKIILSLDSSHEGLKSVCFRGVSMSYLRDRLSKKDEDLRKAEILSRLFYYGDKAKHFLQSNAKLQASNYLKDIEDIGDKSNKALFDKIKGLIKSKNPHIIKFMRENEDFFAFFSDAKNKSIFSSEIIAYGYDLRDYYLKILHTAGNIGIGEKSILVSTSSSYRQSRKFSTEDDPHIIISAARPPIVAGRFLLISQPEIKSNLPILDSSSAIFPEQQ